jgi:dihydrodipicolinate synthase/N-acetylneuraminate lyase
LSLAAEENRKLIQYLTAGGVTTLLYGGNAVLYHVAPSEYAGLLDLLADAADDETYVIPSVGPAYGTMIDQARILKDYDFPTAMVLPQRDVSTSAGVAAAVRKFVEVSRKPAVLYIKHDGFIEVDTVRRLMDDGLLSWIKYAIVRDDPADDDFLRRLVDAVGPSCIVSGIGEQPAPTHLRDFGLVSFTSGCVCVAPRLSMRLLRALRQQQWDKAERIRETFQPLEDLRNRINPIRVLHAAVQLAGLAETGPLLPLLTSIDDAEAKAVQAAALDLKAAEEAATAVT